MNYFKFYYYGGIACIDKFFDFTKLYIKWVKDFFKTYRKELEKTGGVK